MIIFCTPHLVSTQSIFSKIQISFHNFAFFYRKITYSVTQKSIFQENAFKKAKARRPFFCKAMGSNNSFTLIENNFVLLFFFFFFFFFKIAKFEFKVPVHYYSLWVKCTQLWPLNSTWRKKGLSEFWKIALQFHNVYVSFYCRGRSISNVYALLSLDEYEDQLYVYALLLYSSANGSVIWASSGSSTHND